ncbi:MAG: hypothetical protein M1457_12825, partial [bacterium]|nr:hypothetical protein [bacterium]
LIRLRAFGVSPAGAAALALGEVGALAGAAVAAAGGTIYLAARWAAGAAAAWTANLAWFPAGLFTWSGGWLAAFSAVILLLTLLPALPMLWNVIRAEPAQYIRDM